MSSKRTRKHWLSRHVSDPFVKQAQSEGQRSRAVYKLQAIDRKDRLFRPGMTVVDLGAAPGGWSDYAKRRVGNGGVVIAIDRLEMAPIPGVQLIHGDLNDLAIQAELFEHLSGQKADCVLSDMAPNLTGITITDQARIVETAE